jgi:hypothetical protein
MVQPDVAADSGIPPGCFRITAGPEQLHFPLSEIRRHMKFLPTIVLIIVQQGAMICFMRVARWDIFLSAGSAALVAVVAALIMHFALTRRASQNKRA